MCTDCNNNNSNKGNINMSKKQNKSQQPRFGLFYRSHGKWTGPYAGKTFTAYSINRNPMKADMAELKNRVLKSRVQILPVK